MTTPKTKKEAMIDDVRLADEERRGNAYKLLSECYHPPDEEVFELLEVAESLDGLSVQVGELVDAAPEKLESLQVDYAKLFVGPFELQAPPYGSVYLEDGGQVMTDSTRDVADRYRRAGLDIDLDEPPDHVAAELEFAYVLVAGTLRAIASGDYEEAVRYLDRRRNFLSTHLGRWIDEFAENVKTNAETEFYPTLANQTATFVRDDANRLSSRVIAEDGNSPEDVLEGYLPDE